MIWLVTFGHLQVTFGLLTGHQLQRCPRRRNSWPAIELVGSAHEGKVVPEREVAVAGDLAIAAHGSVLRAGNGFLDELVRRVRRVTLNDRVARVQR